MFYKNNRCPAFATVGASSQRTEGSKLRELFVRSEQSAEDDLNAFGSFEPRPTSQGPKERPRQDAPRQYRAEAQRKQQHYKKANAGKQIPWAPIATVAGAVVAVVLLIVILVAIFSAPQKNIKMEDNVYFTYIDADGNYRLVSNGEVLDAKLSGEVELIPAADRSFAYVFENVDDGEKTGIKMYILKGKKLSAIEAIADEIIDTAEYEPGIVYKEGSNFTFYSSDEHSPITSRNNADNFMLSGDASAVIYTTESSNDEQTKLNYFRGGISLVIGPGNITPKAVSIDGGYVYGLHASGIFTCVKVEDDGEKFENIQIAKSSAIGVVTEITAINAKGNEIIFCTAKGNTEDEEASVNVVSYMYKIKDSEPKQIAEGRFTPIYSDSSVVCPETFLNSYFECEKTVSVTVDGEDTDKEVTYTYYLDKSKGARLVASTTGVFSADEKYFYYIDQIDEYTKKLMRVEHGSKDFSKDKELIMEDVHSFSVIDNGDVYVMRTEDASLNKGHIYFWDSSTGKPNRISFNANLDSMQAFANSIFFEETDDEDVVTVYVSTEGSAKEKAEFKNSTPTVAPTVMMGSGNKGYAFFADESGSTKLFYTSNGKKFSLKEKNCTIIGYDEAPTPPENEGNEDTTPEA